MKQKDIITALTNIQRWDVDYRNESFDKDELGDYIKSADLDDLIATLQNEEDK